MNTIKLQDLISKTERYTANNPTDVIVEVAALAQRILDVVNRI